jgi:hypothetical protein
MKQELKLLDSVKFVAGTLETEEIPRVFVAKKWQLRLKVTVTNTTLTSGQTYGSAQDSAPASLLKRIDLRVVGMGKTRTQLIKSFSGQDIVKASVYEQQGAQELVVNFPTGTTSTGAGDTISYASLDVNFSIPDTRDVAYEAVDRAGRNLPVPNLYSPKDMTLFDPLVYNPVEVIVTWGTIADLATGYTAGVLTLKDAELKIYTMDLPEINAGKSGNARVPFLLNREMNKEQTNTGASTDMRIDLPKGNYIRKVVIHAIDNGAYSNSIINNVKVVINENTNVVDASFNAIRNENAKNYGIAFANLKDGIAIIDFDERKDLKGLLDVTNVDNVRLSLDINAPTGTSKVHIVVQEITPQ